MPWIYGRNPVWEYLKDNRVSQVYVAQNLAKSNSKKIQDILDISSSKSLSVIFKPARWIDNQITNETGQPVNHQGVIALLREDLVHVYSEWDDFWRDANQVLKIPYLFLILDSIYDPHNLGAIIRSAEQFGVDGVIFPRHRSLSITPAVIKASSGAIGHVNLIQVTNIANTLRRMKELDIWVYGTQMENATRIDQIDLVRNLAIVLGMEGKGMRQLTRKLCDDLMYIPRFGRLDSLNVSVAAGVVLYECRRQRLGCKCNESF